MSANAPSPDKQQGHDRRRITGPIPEYNRFDEFTGVTYHRCRACDAEALEREHLTDCCPEARDES